MDALREATGGPAEHCLVMAGFCETARVPLRDLVYGSALHPGCVGQALSQLWVGGQAVLPVLSG